MRLSKEHKVMIAEAIVSIIVGYVNNTAGTILTVASIALHLQFDRPSEQTCPYEKIVNGNTATEFPHCKECPLLKKFDRQQGNEENAE